MTHPSRSSFEKKGAHYALAFTVLFCLASVVIFSLWGVLDIIEHSLMSGGGSGGRPGGPMSLEFRVQGCAKEDVALEDPAEQVMQPVEKNGEEEQRRILKTETASDRPFLVPVDDELVKPTQNSGKNRSKPESDPHMSKRTTEKTTAASGERPEQSGGDGVGAGYGPGTAKGDGSGSEVGVGSGMSGQTDRYAKILALLIREVERNKKYPLQARRTGIQGTVTLKITLDSLGTIVSCSISEGSGREILDTATRELGQKLLGKVISEKPDSQNLSVLIPVKYILK